MQSIRNATRRAGSATATFMVLGAAGALASSVAGCSLKGDPSLDTAAFKTGSLGNGEFSFECDDSVACAQYHNYATKFPDAVAEGALFHVQFTPKDQSVYVVVDDQHNSATAGTNNGQGDTIDAVGKGYLSLGPTGFSGIKPGFGTIVVRDQKGWVVDFTTVTIAAPDAVVVYDADYAGTTPTPVTDVSLTTGESKSFRTLARQKGRDLAGTFISEWKATDTSIADVVGYDGGKVTIIGKKEGTATFTVAGAALTEQVSVTVKGGAQ